MLPTYSPTLEETDVIQALDFEGLETLTEVKTAVQIKREKWDKSKLTYFSGSEMERLCGYETKEELPDGAYSYISEKVYETIFGEKYKSDIYETEDILRGRKYELPAVSAVEKETNISFSYTGENQKFFKRGGFGATPDGLSKMYSLEIKCPNFANHNKYKRMKKGEDLKKFEKKYWYQVQSEMFCTNRDKAIFASFYVNEKTGYTDLFWIIVNKCDKTQELIQKRVNMANSEKRKQVKTYKKPVIID
ncbi:YqaJ viral recombinase family protein [Chryseobacterium viscerum]|uniref:YqaJ viral recombinase family protein n=1 Tax=Chryseobacterium viscerum TaxID=1037377 RepID=A0A5N4BK48_9FLAO|nr:YqaJ viral recombinase family protein [Chryseobacterium viscerum]KAB1228485.1 YqaJ viral recombinase family protein [Chryseobacterium viscerum]